MGVLRHPRQVVRPPFLRAGYAGHRWGSWPRRCLVDHAELRIHRPFRPITEQVLRQAGHTEL